MRPRLPIAAVALVALLTMPVSAQDAKGVIAAATTAMGAGSLDSVSYYGSGANFTFGQSNIANGPWPRVNLNDYRRAIDFRQPASRATAVTLAPSVQGGAADAGRSFSRTSRRRRRRGHSSSRSGSRRGGF